MVCTSYDIFPATKFIAETYSQLRSKLPDIQHYVYDSNWFPKNFVNITEVPSKIIQKLSINHSNIEIKNYNSQNQSFTCTKIPENSSTSLEASPIENMDTIIHSQPTDTCINETTDFISTLLDEGTLFSSHTVKTLIDLDDNGQNNNQTNDTNHVTNDITNNTNIYQNNQHRQPVRSTELTQNSDPLNTALSILPNVKKPLLRRQNSVHFNTESVILN